MARSFTLEVARSMGHVHEAGNFTGLSLPLKTADQREFAAYVVAALNAFEPPAKTETA
jgi:hypothetical protein